MNIGDQTVAFCPLTGRSPLCSNDDCKRERKNNFNNCRKILSMKPIISSPIKCHEYNYLKLKKL